MIEFSVYLYVATGISTVASLHELYSVVRYFALCMAYDLAVISITWSLQLSKTKHLISLDCNVPQL